MVLEETLRCKLHPNRCTTLLLLTPIGTYQRPIQWYHRRPSTTYRLATIQTLQTDGQNSVPEARPYYPVRSAKNKKAEKNWNWFECFSLHNAWWTAAQYVSTRPTYFFCLSWELLFTLGIVGIRFHSYNMFNGSFEKNKFKNISSSGRYLHFRNCKWC